MKTKKLQIALPIFTGFYSTIFEPTNEGQLIDEYNYKFNRDYGWDNFEFNYKDYNERVAKRCMYFVEDKIKEVLNLGLKFRFIEINSPKEYNFRNDKIMVEICLSEKDFKTIKYYLKIHKDKFKEYIEDKFTTISGFISFWSNDLYEWLTDYLQYDFKDLDFTIEQTLCFILENEGITEDEMYYSLSNEGEVYLNYSVKHDNNHVN